LSFDAKYGYLKNVFVDYSAILADEERGITVSDFGID
jgi:hypothetical protein